MNTTTNTFIALLSIVALTVGCIALGAKKTNQQQLIPDSGEKKSVTDLNNLAATCFKRITNSGIAPNDDPYYFLYRLDVADTNCTVKKASDLIGANKLIVVGKNDSLGLVSTDDINSTKGTKSERYQQYYKGIAVVGYDVLFNYSNNKVSSIAGRFYPNLDISLTPSYPIEQAVKAGIEKLLQYPNLVVKYPGYIDTTRMIANHKVELYGGQKGVALIYVFEANVFDGIKDEYRIHVNAHTGQASIIPLSNHL